MAASNKVATLPGDHHAQAAMPLIALGTSDENVFWKNNTGRTVKVTAVEYVPEAALTGVDTNNMALGVTNKGLLGVGAVVVAPAKAYASGVDLVAFLGDDIPVTTTAADALVAPGEVLSFDKTENGTGLARAAGIARLTYQFDGI